MSTSAGSLLSFLRSRARRRGRAGLPAEPDSPRPQPWEPGLATLVRLPARPVSARPATPARVTPPVPTVLAHARPDPSSLTPAAAIPTVAVPVMAGPAPTTAVPGLAVPDEGAETTLLPSRQDAPGTTINPRRVR